MARSHRGGRCGLSRQAGRRGGRRMAATAMTGVVAGIGEATTPSVNREEGGDHGWAGLATT